MSLIIPNVPHFPVLCFLSVTQKQKKNCEYNKPLEVVFWEGCPVLNVSSIFDPRIFLTTGDIYRLVMSVNI